MVNDAAPKQSRLYNVNVGILGHVDSGKTSLVAALSTTLSTAALDKNPQSKERGITLDLGFSSFAVDMPERLQHLPYDELQVTLVDCPGHASLIKTIIGGAQIIDMMLLVVDVNRGIQTQTAECLVVGELATKDLLVVLNKVDLLPEQGRPKIINKAKKRLSQTLNATKFAGCTMVPTAVKTGTAGFPTQAQGIQELIQEIVKRVPDQPAAAIGPFKFSIDHCFAIRGQGTVLTGTVLSGKAQVGDTLELPELKVSKKVKSMQMFKRPVQTCRQGDRVGICMTQLDASLVERGIACTPGAVPTFTGAIAAVEKIRFFVGQVPSRLKVHVTVGHQTVMGEIQFFGLPDAAGSASGEATSVLGRIEQLTAKGAPPAFDLQQEYVYQEGLFGIEGRPLNPLAQPNVSDAASTSGQTHHGPQWGLLHLSQPITASEDSVIIGSRFDASQDAPTCRLAFYGRILKLIDPTSPPALQQLKIYKLKQKQGTIDRVSPDGLSAVCKGMFKKETDLTLFAGMKVVTAQGEKGVIEGSFGKSGKFKVQFPSGVAAPAAGGNSIRLTFKKFIFDKDKRHMAQ